MKISGNGENRMKIKDTFQLVTVAGEHMVIPIGEQSVDFQAMITLNEAGAFLWEKIAGRNVRRTIGLCVDRRI